MARNTKGSIIINIALIALVAWGALSGNSITPYLFIAWVFIACTLVAKGKVKENEYPFYLFCISLGLLLQVSLLGKHVVGADINSELMFSRTVLREGINFNFPHQYVSSIVVTVIVPYFSALLRVDPVWIYKAALPVSMAGVAPVLYLVWKRQVGALKAWWTTIFFCIVPVVTLEIVGIGKTMVAQFAMALAMLVLVQEGGWKYKSIMLSALTIFCMTCHYAIGLTLVCMMGVMLVLLTIGYWRKWKLFNAGRSILAVLVITLSVSISTGYVYFENTSDGQIVDVVGNIARGVMPDIDALKAHQDSNNPDDLILDDLILDDYLKTAEKKSYLELQPDMVLAGVGLDIGQTHGWQRAFRIVQYITEILILMGLLRILRRRKTINIAPEYAAGIVSGIVILACCILLPKFSCILNMTRFYQLALFWLAPVMIIGIDSIRENNKWIAYSVLMTYFVFTSGLVFEYTKYEGVSSLNPPPNIALSNSRIGLYGVHNSDDLNCAEWLAYESNQSLPIVSGLHSKRLLQSYFYEYPRLRAFKKPDGHTEKRWTVWNLPEGDYYIFLSTWNIETGQLMTHADENLVLNNNVGVRLAQPIPEWIYSNLNIVYQSGKSVILYQEGESNDS